jgi:hypothetical protein
MTQNPFRSVRRTSTVFAASVAVASLSALAQAHQKPVAPSGVEEVCSISFDKDLLRPARVENSALPCLKQAAARLKANLDRKLVLVGVKNPAKDHEAPDNGREEEDATGFDVRLEDLSAYRAVNAKWYLVHYLGANATRIIPTTDERYFAQTVTFYLVPASADYNHNFLGTTKTNEKPCTITPCYSPDEETLSAQRRPPILPGSVDGSAAELQAEQKELAAQRRHTSPVDMDGSKGKDILAPLLPRPTPDHPAATSVIP